MGRFSPDASVFSLSDQSKKERPSGCKPWHRDSGNEGGLPSVVSHASPRYPTEGDESQAKIHPEIAERLGTDYASFAYKNDV